MDDVATVVAEIAGLLRGRGLRRPDLVIGPGLLNALNLDAGVSPVEARDHLVAALRASSSTLPKDLQIVFLHASALTASDRSLGQRLIRAAAALDRDPRTIRRRLAQANVGVATALVRGSRKPVEMGNAWFIEEFEAITDLRGEHPILTARKVAVPTLSGVTVVKEGFGLPRPVPGCPDPQIRVTEGGALGVIERQGDSVWNFTVHLDHPTETGVSQALAIEVVLDSRLGLLPYTTFTAYRPCRFVRTTVHFGAPSVASSVWIHSGVVPIRLSDSEPAETDEIVDLDCSALEDGSVSREFSGLQLGFSYGIHWRWA